MDPDLMLRTIRRAAMLLRATPGRRGMVVHLPEDASEVLVAGDLHGNLTNFRAILEVADLERRPKRHLVLQEFIHSVARVPGGGDLSHRLLDVVCALKEKYPDRVHLLFGNHELAQWAGRRIAKDGASLNDLFRAGVETTYGPRAGEVLEAYDELFSSLNLAVRSANGLFACHSIPTGRHLPEFDVGIFDRLGLDARDVGPASSVYRLLWGKGVSPTTAERFLEIVGAELLVTGHIAQDAGFAVLNPRQIVVDCSRRPAACALVPVDRPFESARLDCYIRML
jgi:hypothetical protein